MNPCDPGGYKRNNPCGHWHPARGDHTQLCLHLDHVKCQEIESGSQFSKNKKWGSEKKKHKPFCHSGCVFFSTAFDYRNLVRIPGAST